MQIGSSDYYHLCNTDSIWSVMLVADTGEPPRTDSAIVGFSFDSHNAREYTLVELDSSLTAGVKYCFSMWVTPRDHNEDGCDRMGALFTSTIPTPNYPPLPSFILADPQIEQTDSVITKTDGWTQVSGSFIADGTERIMTIGVFAPKDSVSHAIINPQGGFHGYYLVDDVALYVCDSTAEEADAGPDQYICEGDSVSLGTHMLPEYRYYWYRDSTLISREARPVVSPDSTTSYLLVVKDFKFDESFDSVRVNVVNCDTIPAACAGADTLICLGDSISLGCFNRPDFSYEWKEAGDTVFSYMAQPRVSPQDPTAYILKTTDYARQESYDSVYVMVVNCNMIFADAGPDSLICLGDSMQLGSPAAEGGSYLWYSGGMLVDSTAQLTVSPGVTTTYLLQVTDPRKTVHEDRCTIAVQECDIPLVVPNVFTPNGDGINDRFVIENPMQAALEVVIFNRWGSIVCTLDESTAWDGMVNGRPAGEGTYFYTVTATLPPYRRTVVSGSVSLLR